MRAREQTTAAADWLELKRARDSGRAQKRAAADCFAPMTEQVESRREQTMALRVDCYEPPRWTRGSGHGQTEGCLVQTMAEVGYWREQTRAVADCLELTRTPEQSRAQMEDCHALMMAPVGH